MVHRPRKRFGQNFLSNQAIITNIIAALNAKAEDCVVEIGPGLGALTQPLLKQLPKLTAIEIDRDLYQQLQQLPYAKERLTLINADALTVDFSQWGGSVRLVGNLPYNIATPLLLHLLDYLPAITDMHFMLQKEVVERLAAQPHSKAYGRLSIIMQYYCEITHLFDVPPSAFYPQPKVDSAIVRLVPYRQSPYALVNRALLEKVVAQAFAMRRKTLANNLKPLITATALEELGISPKARAEELSINDYIRLAQVL